MIHLLTAPNFSQGPNKCIILNARKSLAILRRAAEGFPINFRTNFASVVCKLSPGPGDVDLSPGHDDHYYHHYLSHRHTKMTRVRAHSLTTGNLV